MVILLGLFSACSEDDPSIRVRNDLDAKANVQLKPQVGSTLNINDVQGESMSGETVLQEGVWDATASIQSSNADPTINFDVKSGIRYTLVIVNTEPPVFELLTEDK